MEVQNSQEGNVLVVKLLNKRLDAREAEDFKQKMSRYFSGGNHALVLDMSEVDFVDSSGLGALVAVFKALGEQGRLAVCGTRDSVMRMFKLTRMNKVFELYEGQTEAVTALSVR